MERNKSLDMSIFHFDLLLEALFGSAKPVDSCTGIGTKSKAVAMCMSQRDVCLCLLYPPVFHRLNPICRPQPDPVYNCWNTTCVLNKLYSTVISNSVCASGPVILDVRLVDVPAGVTQEEGHTGFLIHLPPAVLAFIFLARRIQPFLCLVDFEVEFSVLTN